MEEVRVALDRLVGMELVVKRGKYYGRPYGRRFLKPRRAAVNLDFTAVKAY